MILTREQKDKLHELAFAEVANKDISEQMGLPLTEIHAARHRMGITRDKVAATKGNTVVKAAPSKSIINKDFEAAVQQMEADNAKRNKPCCSNCAHWACYAVGSSCTVPDCIHHIFREARQKSYLHDRKREFICAIARTDLGILPVSVVQKIKSYLDEYIPEDWGAYRG